MELEIVSFFCDWIGKLMPLECMQMRFMQTAMLGLILIAPMAALAGTQVVNFRMAFFSDAIGHSAFAGVAFGLLFALSPGITMPLLALIVGIGIMAVKQRSGLSTDTIIGVFFSAVVAAGLFVILLIPAIIICVFIPRSVEKLRSFETVAAIDGAFGAVVVTAIVFAALIFLGALVWQISDLQGLAVFNSYMERTHVADALYGDNYVGSLGFIVDLPLRAWVGLD